MSDIGDRGEWSEQDEAEALDDDVLGGADYPPDEPMGLPDLLGRDVVSAGEYAADSVVERSVREQGSERADAYAVPAGFVDDGPDGETDLTADRGEADLEDRAFLSDELPRRPEDPSPEAAAMHLVDDDERDRD